jgi:hypothetical protein
MIPFHAKFNENNIYFFSHNLFKIFCVVAMCYKNFPLIFYKVQISTNYEKIILKFIVLSIPLARQISIFPVVREITCIKRHKNV